MTGTTPANAATSPNLIKNPGADLAPGGGDGTALVTIPNWVRTVKATATKYSTGGGFPVPADPGPTDRGVAFFSGGNGANSTLTQQLTLSAAYLNKIKTGVVKLNAFVWLGGFSSQNDKADLRIIFTRGSAVTNKDILGPNAAARGSATKFIKKTLTGFAVPKDTTKISVQLRFTRIDGSYNDGYADSLSLVLTGV